MVTSPTPAARRRWAVGAGLLALVVVGTAAGWLVGAFDDPLAVAVDDVNGGDVSACDKMRRALMQIRAAHPEGVPAPAGYDAAMVACIDRRIDMALALPEPSAREQQLLLVADPEAVLQPNSAQLSRIDELVAPLPDALHNGKPRIRSRSVEVVGKVPLAAVRKLLQKYHIQLRACHAKAVVAAPQLEGDVRIHLDVDGTGTVTRAYPAGKSRSRVLDSCLAELFQGAKLDTPASGRVTAELRLRGW